MLHKKIFIFYFVGILTSLSFYIFLFNVDLSINTFFYKGLLIVFISILFQYFFLYQLNKLNYFLLNHLHIHIVSISTFCFILLLHTLILTSLDRAISVYFISLMNHEKNGLTSKEIKTNFYEEYFEAEKAIERRIKEQLITGNIVNRDEKYFITKRGKITFKIFVVLSKLFNIKNNYLPKYKFK